MQFEVPINAEKIRFVCADGHFSWEDFNTELEKTAPNLFALLNGILHVHSPPSQRKRRKSDKLRHVNKNAILGFCAALLCRYRNQSMNLVQRLISMVLYRGGANKQVHVRAWSFCSYSHNYNSIITYTDIHQTSEAASMSVTQKDSCSPSETRRGI